MCGVNAPPCLGRTITVGEDQASRSYQYTLVYFF
jgi:hypothetical protein